MKTPFGYLLSAVVGIAFLPGGRAADEKSPSKEDKKELRVLTPARERRVVVPRDGERRDKVEMESIAFLGVETAPVSATTAAQLGLQRGTGLAVNNIVPNSPAAGVLQEHDILLKLDDQILIETRQLSVLVRGHKEGDEVSLTYLRGGQKSTTKVKLGKTEAPKLVGALGGGVLPFTAFAPGINFGYATAGTGSEAERARVDRLLSMIQRVPDGDPLHIRIDRAAGPGIHAIAINPGNSNLVFSDDQGSLELTTNDGTKMLVAKNADGDELFAGPVMTPEQRAGMPAGVRQRLEKLEGMHDITFHTDGDFMGTETKIARPRGIAFPLLRELRPPGHPAPFY